LYNGRSGEWKIWKKKKKKKCKSEKKTEAPPAENERGAPAGAQRGRIAVSVGEARKVITPEDVG
jgi:hypothetical protein